MKPKPIQLEDFLKQMTKEELLELILYIGRRYLWERNALAYSAWNVRCEVALNKSNAAFKAYEDASQRQKERYTPHAEEFNATTSISRRAELAQQMTEDHKQVTDAWAAYKRAEDYYTRIYEQGAPAGQAEKKP